MFYYYYFDHIKTIKQKKQEHFHVTYIHRHIHRAIASYNKLLIVHLEYKSIDALSTHQFTHSSLILITNPLLSYFQNEVLYYLLNYLLELVIVELFFELVAELFVGIMF